jgi:hypothetical protein
VLGSAERRLSAARTSYEVYVHVVEDVGLGIPHTGALGRADPRNCSTERPRLKAPSGGRRLHCRYERKADSSPSSALLG